MQLLILSQPPRQLLAQGAQPAPHGGQAGQRVDASGKSQKLKIIEDFTDVSIYVLLSLAKVRGRLWGMAQARGGGAGWTGRGCLWGMGTGEEGLETMSIDTKKKPPFLK